MHKYSLAVCAAVAAVAGFSADALAQGFPGYQQRDSRSTGGPTFAWDDISSSGTLLSFPSTDDGVATVTLPFTFQFFGVNQTSVSVSTNGNMQFGGTSTEYFNEALPNVNPPNNMIAPFWDDLHLNTGSVRRATLGTAPDRRFVVSWLGVTHYPSTSPNRFTFQVQLFETTNTIRIQYLTMADNGGTAYAAGQSATIGCENATGGTAYQFLFNGAPTANQLANNVCVEYRLPPPPTPPGPDVTDNDNGDFGINDSLCGVGAAPAAGGTWIAMALAALIALTARRRGR